LIVRKQDRDWWSDQSSFGNSWEMLEIFCEQNPFAAILHFNVESRKTKLDVLILPCIKSFLTSPTFLASAIDNNHCDFFSTMEKFKKKFFILSISNNNNVFYNVYTHVHCCNVDIHKNRHEEFSLSFHALFSHMCQYKIVMEIIYCGKTQNEKNCSRKM